MNSTEIYYTLTWIQAPRPPVHMSPMTGRQSFDSPLLASIFFNKKAKDSTFVSLEETIIHKKDVTEENKDLFN